MRSNLRTFSWLFPRSYWKSAGFTVFCRNALPSCWCTIFTLWHNRCTFQKKFPSEKQGPIPLLRRENIRENWNLLQKMVGVLLAHWESLSIVIYVFLFLMFSLCFSSLFQWKPLPSHFSPHGTELFLKMFLESVKLRVMFWPRHQTHKERAVLKFPCSAKDAIAVLWFFLKTNDADAA